MVRFALLLSLAIATACGGASTTSNTSADGDRDTRRCNATREKAMLALRSFRDGYAFSIQDVGDWDVTCDDTETLKVRSAKAGVIFSLRTFRRTKRYFDERESLEQIQQGMKKNMAPGQLLSEQFVAEGDHVIYENVVRSGPQTIHAFQTLRATIDHRIVRMLLTWDPPSESTDVQRTETKKAFREALGRFDTL